MITWQCFVPTMDTMVGIHSQSIMVNNNKYISLGTTSNRGFGHLHRLAPGKRSFYGGGESPNCLCQE